MKKVYLLIQMMAVLSVCRCATGEQQIADIDAKYLVGHAPKEGYLADIYQKQLTRKISVVGEPKISATLVTAPLIEAREQEEGVKRGLPQDTIDKTVKKLVDAHCLNTVCVELTIFSSASADTDFSYYAVNYIDDTRKEFPMSLISQTDVVSSSTTHVYDTGYSADVIEINQYGRGAKFCVAKKRLNGKSIGVSVRSRVTANRPTYTMQWVVDEKLVSDEKPPRQNFSR